MRTETRTIAFRPPPFRVAADRISRSVRANKSSPRVALALPRKRKRPRHRWCAARWGFRILAPSRSRFRVARFRVAADRMHESEHHARERITPLWGDSRVPAGTAASTTAPPPFRVAADRIEGSQPIGSPAPSRSRSERETCPLAGRR